MSHSGTVLSSLDRPMKAIVTAALIALLALAGCESGTQEPEAPTAEPVELGAAPTAGGEVEDSAAAPRGDGSIAPERFPAELPDRAEAAIPGNFPSSLPVYPNSTPALGMSGDVDGSDRSAVQLLSNDPPATVSAFYRAELEANGWEITESMSGAGGESITAINGPTKTVIFFRPAEDGGTDIYQLNEG
ncbi:MAG: hypothetical protein CL931_14580 [Deltaproteobacteria bacterium]|nr:hypothetical protein [Deltaproteobacteria bacterium]